MMFFQISENLLVSCWYSRKATDKFAKTTVLFHYCCVLSKVLESVVFNQLYDHCVSNNCVIVKKFRFSKNMMALHCQPSSVFGE